MSLTTAVQTQSGKVTAVGGTFADNDKRYSISIFIVLRLQHF